MAKGLKKYFPMIQTKGAILQEIRQKQQLNDLFPRATSQAAVLARTFGDCRESAIPRSLL